MRHSSIKWCSWCGDERRSTGKQKDSEDQGIHLCSDCNDLVYAGADYRRKLEEVKSTLKRRPLLQRRSKKTGTGLRIGAQFAKCFLNCTVVVRETESVESSRLAETSQTFNEPAFHGEQTECNSHPQSEAPPEPQVLERDYGSITRNSVRLENHDPQDTDGSSVISLDMSSSQLPETSTSGRDEEPPLAELIMVETELLEIKPEEECKMEVDDSSNFVIQKPASEVKEEQLEPSGEAGTSEDGAELPVLSAQSMEIGDESSPSLKQQLPVLQSEDIEILQEMVISIETEEVAKLEDIGDGGPSEEEIGEPVGVDGDHSDASAEDPEETEDSDADFVVNELTSSDEDGEADDPTFDPKEPQPRCTRRQTRASAKKAGEPGQDQETSLPPESSSTASTKYTRILSKIATTASQTQQKQGSEKHPKTSSSTLVPRFQKSKSVTPFLTETTVTRQQCLFCSDRVPETSDHLLGVHNLVRQFGNYYSCHSCLQAYQPLDPATRTGLLTVKDIANFKEFVNHHENCQDQLEETNEPQICRICKTEFRSGPDCIRHEYKSHPVKLLVSDQAICTLCPEVKGHPAKLEKHMNQYHQKELLQHQRLYGCCICSAALQSPRDFSIHSIYHGFSNFSATQDCILCESHSDSVVNLYGHYFSKHALDFINFSHFACVNCNQAFQSPSETHLPSGKALTANRSELESFVQAHSRCTITKLNSVTQQCRFCSFTTSKADLLIEHEKCNHQQEMPADSTMRCKVCSLPCDDLQFVEHLFRHNPPDKDLLKQSTSKDRVSITRTDSSQCSKCDAVFMDRNAYISHCNVHVMDERTKNLGFRIPNVISDEGCLLCGCFYRRKNRSIVMTQHFHEKHSLVRFLIDLNSYFACKSCSTPFEASNPDQPLGLVTPEDIEAFKMFAAQHSSCSKEAGVPNLKCRKPDCCSTFNQLEDFATHNEETHCGSVKCPFCSTSLDSRHDFRSHLLSNHSQMLLVETKCHSCWKQFYSFEQLESHLAEHDKAQPPLALAGFSCLSCNLFFDSTALLALHMQEYHDRLPELSFNCLRCSQVLKSADCHQSGTFALEIQGNLRKFTTFTALCSQHLQGCMARNIAQPCIGVVESDLRCYACNDASSDTLQDFAVHLNSHLGFRTAFKCPVCIHVSATECAHWEHVASGHNLGNLITNYYHCSTCSEPWKSEIEDCGQGQLRNEDTSEFLLFAQRHAKCRDKPLKKFKCKFCHIETSALTTLYHHEISDHTWNFPLFCDQCGQGFFFEASRDEHLKSKGIHLKKKKMLLGPREVKRPDLSSSVKPYNCQHCSKSFAKPWILKTHEAAHERAQKKPVPGELHPHVCDVCGKDFATSHSLKLHQRVHAEPKPVTSKSFICDICGKVFHSKEGFKLHKCKSNEKDTREKSQANGEPQVDGGEPPQKKRRKRNPKKSHLCSECGKVFQNLRMLRFHTNIHTGDRPYKCKECDKAFMGPHHLRIHQKLHQENRERNVPCPQCDKMFFRKTNVDQHVRVFHNKLPWPSKIKSYKKWIPKNPEALAASGIEYKRKSETESENETESEETEESDTN